MTSSATFPAPAHIAPWSLRRSLFETLAPTSNALTAEIALSLPDDHFRSQFLLSQGVICDGACRNASDSFGLNDSPWFEAIAQGVERHRPQLLDALRARLKMLIEGNISEKPDGWTDETLLHGSIVLTGCFRLHELEAELQACWELVPPARRATFFPAVLWSTLVSLQPALSGESGASPFLQQLLDFWAELSDERIAELGGMTERSKVSHSLRSMFAVGRGSCPERAVQHLVERARRDSRLTKTIDWALHLTDLPMAMELLVERAIADYAQHKWVHWVHDLPREWNGDMWEKRAMSPATRAALKALWQNEDLGSVGRDLALRLWCSTLSQDDIELLRAIPPESNLFKVSIELRAVNSDFSCVSDLLVLGQSNDIWLQYADSVWCPQLLPLAHHWAAEEKTLGGKYKEGISGAGYTLARLLTKIPEADAEAVLEAHWEHLQRGPNFVQAALWIGTPRCLELARQAIEDFPPERDPFHYFEIHIPVRSPFHGEPDVPERVQRFLRNVLPYVSRLDEDDKRSLAEGCCRVGAQAWGRQHLAPHLSPSQRSHYFPTDEDRMAELDVMLQRASERKRKGGVAREAPILVHLWLESLERWHEPLHTGVEFALRWFERTPDESRVWIALAAVHQAGNRAHLTRLEQLLEHLQWDESSRQRMAQTLADARFVVCRRTLE